MISCATHDYVEIACLYRIEVILSLKTGSSVQGIAFETTYNNNREECMILKTPSGTAEVVLDHITTMQAVTSNPHFEKLRFY